MPRKMTPARRAYIQKWRKEHRDRMKAYWDAANLKARGEPGSEQRARYNADAALRNRKAKGGPETERRERYNAKRREHHHRKMQNPDYREHRNTSSRVRRKISALADVRASQEHVDGRKLVASAKNLAHKASLKAFLVGRTTAPVKPSQAAPAPVYTGKLTPGGF